MQRRYQHLNIPIEIIRTIVAISETGSLSKAAERLGISQPAISSQIKRLQSLVGGALFVKTANGTTTTELGKLALHQAKRILEANDQLLRLGGNTEGPQVLRLGLSTLFVDEFIRHQTAETHADLFIHVDHSIAIAKGLIDGYVDVGCFYDNSAIEAEVEQMVVNETEEQSVWVRSREFVLRPGAPIPILTWPGDDWMIRTLTKHGLSYKVVLFSPDYQARLAAAKAGIGLTAIPARMAPPYLVKAREYYLPELPLRKAFLCVRLGVEGNQVAAVVKQLSTLFFKGSGIAAEAEIA